MVVEALNKPVDPRVGFGSTCEEIVAYGIRAFHSG